MTLARPPALLDRIIPAGEPASPAGPRAEAARRFPEEEPFFAGHFPGMPVVPGVFMLEALAECARRALDPERTGKAGALRLVALSRVRFRRRVAPGEELRLSAVRTGTESGRHVFSRGGRRGWSAGGRGDARPLVSRAGPTRSAGGFRGAAGGTIHR